jgi:hypothetical protein
MPYIKVQGRIKFDAPSCEDPMEWIGSVADNAGDLNFAVTSILKAYLHKKGECYATHNEIMGMLDCCAKEWYRRKVAPYEDQKIKENGDV